MATCRERMEKGYFEYFWNGSQLAEEETEDLEIVDTEINNQNEREGKINMEWSDREGWRRKIQIPTSKIK